MDLDTENDERPEITYQCQTCNFKVTFTHEPIDEIQRHVTDWCLHVVHAVGGKVEIMTCPACADLPLDQIYSKFQAWVRGGNNIHLH